MLNTSSFEEFSRLSKEESVSKTLGITSASLEESYVEVTSSLSKVVVAEESCGGRRREAEKVIIKVRF